MHGFCGVISTEKNFPNVELLSNSINLAKSMHVEFVNFEHAVFVVSYLISSPLKGDRFFETENHLLLFSGDLVNYKTIPWHEIQKNLEQNNFEWFSSLRGNFAIASYNKHNSDIILISDQRAQFPVYYSKRKEFVFSSDLSTFSILNNLPRFNVNWLYEFIFFNFPVDKTTFFEEVDRLRPATYATFKLNNNDIIEKQYDSLLKKNKIILTGKKALNLCIKLFKERVPKYFNDFSKNLVAISAGFDTRTIVSLAPNDDLIDSYTYGVKNSNDLNEAIKLTKKVGINHTSIHFNEHFKKQLPQLIYDTVKFSGGTQTVIRGTLLYVYRSLAKKGIPVVIGGIGGDMFRGYGNNSDFAVASFGADKYFRTGEAHFESNYYSNLFGSKTFSYHEHIKSTLEKITKLYGNPLHSDSPMSYTIYEVYPKYFGGEHSLASNFMTFRQPFWDMDLIELCYKTELGNLQFTGYRSTKRKGSYGSYVLQSKVICQNKSYKKTWINGVPISLFSFGNKFLFSVGRIIIRGYYYLKYGKINYTPLEDWHTWFEIEIKNYIDDLLNDDSLINKYIDSKILNIAKKNNDVYLLNKLMTTELILILIKRKWDLKS